MTTIQPTDQHYVITVYTKPSCVQCEFTKRKLDMLGLAYDTVDVTKYEAALNFITKDLGYLAAPVVYAWGDGDDEQHWSGFQPERLAGLC
jgi:glutaredoxin-like protein NrdH